MSMVWHLSVSCSNRSLERFSVLVASAVPSEVCYDFSMNGFSRGSSTGASEPGEISPGFPVEEEALAEVRELLLRAVRRRCPKWLIDESEDLVQDVLVKLTEKTGSSREVTELAPGYVVRAAYNHLVDEIRKRRNGRLLLQPAESGDERVDDLQPGPDRSYQSRQIGRAVWECLGNLQAPRRQAVTLYLRGHKAKSSAQILGCPVRKVQNLVFRGIRDLRQCLAEKGVAR